MKAWKVKVEIKPWPDGGYIARAPSLQGCWVVAPSVEEALRDMYEGIEMCITSRIKHQEPLPKELEEISVNEKGRVEVIVPVVVP